jgi:hypothetical protein
MTIETFKPFGQWEQMHCYAKEPYSFNGQVNVKRYRITVEEIEEPREVLLERLRELWRKRNEGINAHLTAREIIKQAKALGVELSGELPPPLEIFKAPEKQKRKK